MEKSKIPVIVGASQFTQAKTAITPLDPLGMIKKTSMDAFRDTTSAGLLEECDCVSIINIMSHSYKDICAELSSALGISPKIKRYGTIGGNTPQDFVNRSAREIAEGKVSTSLIAGAEAVNSVKKALRGQLKIDWPASAPPMSFYGDARDGSSPLEHAYGIVAPAYMFALFENAFRHSGCLNFYDHNMLMGKVCEKLSHVAAENPLAWSRDKLLWSDIILPGSKNRKIGFPYTLRMAANVYVDQSAAIVLTNLDTAEKRGVPETKMIFPLGGAALHNIWHVSRRPMLHESPALRRAADVALDQAGLVLSDITIFDLYSCFPYAVEIAMSELGIPIDDPRPITVTGGLPYFGGPGNNYSLHAIAEMVDRIRSNRRHRGLITSAGWYNTKWSVGIYGGTPTTNGWQKPMLLTEIQREIDSRALNEPLKAVNGHLKVDSYLYFYNKYNTIKGGVVLGSSRSGKRAYAMIDANHDQLARMESIDLVGKTGVSRYDPERDRNFLNINLKALSGD